MASLSSYYPQPVVAGTTDGTFAEGDDSRIVGAVQKSIVDAKGDLIVGSADNTVARLPVGTSNGQTLQIDSSTATGLKWAAAAEGGSTPSGPAGGGLAGTYPNPTLAPVAIPYTTNTRSISDRFADDFINVKDFGARAGYINFSGSISGTTLTVHLIQPFGTFLSSLENPVFESGMIINALGVGAVTTVVSQLTGTTGGVGTYQLSKNNGTLSQRNMSAYVDCSLPFQRAIYYASGGVDGAEEAMSLTFDTMISGGYLGFPLERLYLLKQNIGGLSGRTVYFPAGEYMISRPIVIGAYIKLLGSGEQATQIFQPAGATFNTIEDVGYRVFRKAGEDYPDVGTVVSAGNFVVNKVYQIETVGNTNWVAIGAAASPTPTVGTRFVASGVGSGTGTAKVVIPTSQIWSDVAGFNQFSRIEGFGIGGHTRSFDHPRNNLTSCTWVPAKRDLTTYTQCSCVSGQKIITLQSANDATITIGSKIRFRNYPDIYTVEKIGAGTITVEEPLQVTLTIPNENHLLYGAPAQNGIVFAGGENTRISHNLVQSFAGAGIWAWGGSPSPVIDNNMSTANDVAYRIDNAPTTLIKPSGDANNVFIECGSWGWNGFYTAIDIKHEEPRISYDQNSSYAKAFPYSDPNLFRSMFKVTTFGIGSPFTVQLIGGSINLPEGSGRNSSTPKTLIDFISRGGGTPLQININGLRYCGSQNFLYVERDGSTGKAGKIIPVANTNSYHAPTSLNTGSPNLDYYPYLSMFSGPPSNLDLMAIRKNTSLSTPEFDAGILLNRGERKLLSTATFTRTTGSAPATVTVTYQHSTNATALKVGQWYKITTSGDTDWTDCGATANTVGTIFICTKRGIGTGVADEIHGICVGDFVYLQNFTSTTGSGNLAAASQVTNSQYLQTGTYEPLFRVLTTTDTTFTVEAADSGFTAATCTVTAFARSYFHGLERNNHIFEMSGPLGNNFDLYKAFTIYDSHKRHLAGLRVATANTGDWWANNSLNIGGTIDSPSARILTGTNAPAASAPNGSLYLRTGGTADTTLYVRADGNWTALTST
jgi:hypothetical protein